MRDELSAPMPMSAAADAPRRESAASRRRR